MNKLYLLTLLAMICGAVTAADKSDQQLQVAIEIPRLSVAEYHRPYIAVWIQNEARKVEANLAVWYQMKGPRDDIGTKWLPDLRQWWRRSGRSLSLPVDGVSGATRPVGTHNLAFSEERLTSLSPGRYSLVVEAAREVGGRELLTVDFDWPAKDVQQLQVQGERELGKVSVTVMP